MHMADALISPAVGGAMFVVSASSLALASKKIGTQDDAVSKIPLMAVTGALVFSAQMINFAVPGTGSSGHLGGGVLLAALLGPWGGFLSMSVILLVQALFFADGGILAYGCNLFNLGLVPCFLIYPLIFRPLASRGSAAAIFWAAFISSIAALQIGSLFVVLQTLLSGRTQLPWGVFLSFMQPIHLVIGLVEGAATGSILSFIYAQKPQMLYCGEIREIKELKETKNFKKPLLALFSAALLLGGVVSLAASEYPDGLEWSISKAATGEVSASGKIFGAFAAFQEKFSPMPDYNFVSGSSKIGTSTAGLAGSLITLVGLAAISGLAFLFFKKKNVTYKHKYI